MNQERFRQIDELLDAVLDLPEAEREAFLSQKSKGDDELKNEVLSLLKAQSNSNSFLEKSAIGVAARNLADGQNKAKETNLFGKKIGTYKIESLLGSGGMGDVYLASDEKLHRKVALKILPAEYTTNDERVKRFQLEARAISALNHPNIFTIYDVGTHEGINYIATEYVEGKTLRELIGSGLKLKEILGIIIQTCEALSAAHTAGIIHRDIKPENIIVRPDGYVKVLDFGLAKLSEVDLNTLRNFNQTAKGIIIGTPAYMSPEQVADEKVDHRTDLWSVGVVLYELLTGVNPFKKSNRQSTFQAVLSEDPPSASSLNAEIPTELDRILVKALEKDADLSYQTASDFRADLKRIKRELDSSPSLRSGSLTQSNNGSKTRNYLILLPFAFLLFTLLVWYFYFRTPINQSNVATEWTNANNVQLTDSPWVEGYPSLSPDGKNIIFASESSNDRNIFLQRVGGKNLINLTPNAKENDTMPTYSADGKFIAFRSERKPEGIYVMEETGENTRRISDIGFHPSWSHDGKKVVVSDKAAAVHTVHSIPNSSLYVIEVESGNKQKIETGGDAIMPNWSPNGHRIAFWSVNDGSLGDIATVPATGGEPVIIANDVAADWNPVWSPDGKYLYFASDRKGNMNLWRVPIDEKTGEQRGEPESVSTPSKYCRHITISRDGKLLGYVRYESQSNLQAIEFDPKQLKTASEIQWITRGDKEISNPVLSPDGTKFVARQPTRTQEDLIVFDRDGQNWRSLMNDRFRERLPRWSPDSAKIAFQTDRSKKYQIWMINPDGSDLRQITFSEKTGAINAVFSPDGRQMVFTEIDYNQQKSQILDLTKSWAEQTPQSLPALPENQSFSVRDWSKDGKKLLFIYFEPDGDENGIGVFDLQQQKFEKISEYGTSPVWLDDNRNIIFTARNSIYLADLETKKITQLYKPSAYELQQANLSPQAGFSSGNRLLFWRYLQVNADVWLLDATQK